MAQREDDMTPEQRLEWLRERGVLVETAEERRIKKVRDAMNEEDVTAGEAEYEGVSFVHVPHDESQPLRQSTARRAKTSKGVAGGDILLEHLGPFFKACSTRVDLDLLQNQAPIQHVFGSTDSTVSHEALKFVAEQGNVEAFCLVHATPSNKFTAVNIYLDEAGMLKRLPLNKRAAEFAFRAGFNPPPQFYGDVFLGKLRTQPVLTNIDFKTGSDTAPDAAWLKAATMENLEYQTAKNRITGEQRQTQPAVSGEDGVAKSEQGGLYSWTQTDDEVEVIVPVLSPAKTKDVQVKFHPRKLQISFQGKVVLTLDFFARINPDGCTWTVEHGETKSNIVLTCEKSGSLLWPRIAN